MPHVAAGLSHVRKNARRALLIGVCLCLGVATAALAQSGDHATVVFDVTPTTAQVTAVVDPPGEVGSYYFEWGTDDSYANKSDPIALGMESGAREVGGTITGLTSSTTYVVRVVVTGEGDPVVGPPTAFTTSAEPVTTPPDTTPGPSDLTPRQTPESTPDPDEAEQGEAVVVQAASGTVTVKQEGTDDFAELADGATIPVGSLVDATQGTVRLFSEAGDDTQQVLVRDGKFEVRQASDGSGITDLVLRGGNFSSCGRAQSSGTRRPRHPRRSLWARDRGGRFRTRGLNSVATVRGTTWRTTDTCTGTTTSVTAGSVLVRELRTRRTAIVRKGQRYLARRQ